MKSRLIIILLLVCMTAVPFNNCFAVTVDGTDNGVEWANANCNVLLTEKDSNNVDYGAISYVVGKNGFDIYFLIYFSDKIDPSYKNAKIILTFYDDVISIDCKGDVVNPDPNSYVINTVVNVVENDGCYCELKIGFKKGVPGTLSGKVCFVDGNGTHSYHYPFTVKNSNAATTYGAVFTTETKSEKITSERNTALKSTRPRATKSDSPAVNTVADKTTKNGSGNVADNQTVVYFFEKDVIVSEVYINSHSDIPVEPVCDVNNENVIQPSGYVDEKSAMYNDGIKYFRFVCVICGILLGALAVWVGLNRKKYEEVADNKFEPTKDDSTISNGVTDKERDSGK